MNILKHPDRLRNFARNAIVSIMGFLSIGGGTSEEKDLTLLYPDTAIVRTEQGKTFLDTCFAPDNGPGPDIVGSVAIGSFGYKYNNYTKEFDTLIKPVFTSQNEDHPQDYNISLAYLTKRAAFRGDEAHLFVSNDDEHALVCSEELPSTITLPPQITDGSLVMLGRGSKHEVVVVTGPFNETTHHVIDQGFVSAYTTLPDGHTVHVEGAHASAQNSSQLHLAEESK